MLSRTKHERGERGAVAVEAALVLPILIVMMFGIVELTMMVRDSVAITSATRQGARIGSSEAGAGPGTCETGPPTPPPCTSSSSPKLAQDVADAIQRAGSAMPKSSIDYILVYDANDKGFPGANGLVTMPSSCSGVSAGCVKFVWRDSAAAFRYDSGSWDSKSINACAGDANSDTLGVYMHTTHTFITGLLWSSAALDDRAVMKFEPLGVDSCKSTSIAPHP